MMGIPEFLTDEEIFQSNSATEISHTNPDSMDFNEYLTKLLLPSNHFCSTICTYSVTRRKKRVIDVNVDGYGKSSVLMFTEEMV